VDVTVIIDFKFEENRCDVGGGSEAYNKALTFLMRSKVLVVSRNFKGIMERTE
jgi:hypothetical protein